MGFATALLGFGIGIFGAGFFYALLQDIITRYLTKYIIYNDAYYLSSLMWDGLPYVLIFVGIACMILGGLARKGVRVVSYE